MGLDSYRLNWHDILYRLGSEHGQEEGKTLNIQNIRCICLWIVDFDRIIMSYVDISIFEVKKISGQLIYSCFRKILLEWTHSLNSIPYQERMRKRKTKLYSFACRLYCAIQK